MTKFLNNKEGLPSTTFQRNKSKILEALKSGAGFTFTELMVIIAVITIFTVISFPYYSRIRQNLALERSALKFTQDIRKAQEMAMSAKKFNESVPAGGYGIYFNINNPDYYILFADRDNNKRYTNSLERVEYIYLEENVKLENCGPLAGPCEEFSVTYSAPDPEGFFELMPNGGIWDSGGFDANVEISINGNIKIINLNKVGLLDID